MMNKTYLWAALGLALGFSACSPNEHKETSAEELRIDSPMVSDGHNAENALDWAGKYEGTLPCADCPGLKTIVQLNTNMTFELEEEYLERNVQNKEQGSFSWEKDGSTVVLKTKSGSMKFFVKENGMTLLDQEGNKMQGEMAPYFEFKKLP